MKRLFIAIKIEPDKGFLEQLFQLKLHLKHEKIKWVEEQNIHVTLKFLGDTESKKLPEITGALLKVAEEHSPFTIRLNTLGIFGSRYDPRVIWAGIEPYDHLVMLMKDVHSELKTAGFEPGRQNIVPHLTIGRIKEIKDKQLFQGILDKFRKISSDELNVRECVLFESILKREGPVYVVQGIFPFTSIQQQ